MNAKFRSIEYRDQDGDVVIRHAFLSDVDSENLMFDLIESGVTNVSITNLQSSTSEEIMAELDFCSKLLNS